MSIIIPANTLAAAGGFSVDNSCRFDYASSDNVHKTPGSAGSGTKFVFSTWIKRTKLATAMNIIYAQTATNNYERIRFVGTDKIEISGVASGSTAYNFATDAVYRDPSAWMHLHVIRDSTQGTASNRLKVYVNGVLQALTQDTALSQNYSGLITGANVHRIAIGNGEPLGAYLAEVILLDGQVITPDGNTGEFDEDSGIWKPIDVSGLTFGTTGFHLDFQASGNLGNDANGGDDFTEVNLAATNQSTDTCTNNFATMLPLTKSTDATLSEGNLNVTYGTASTRRAVFGSMVFTAGKWYCETKVTATSQTSVEMNLGISNTYNPEAIGNALISANGFTVSLFPSNGSLYIGSTRDEQGLGNLAVNDIIGMAINIDDGTLQFYKNGSALGSANDITTGDSDDGELYPGFTIANSCSSGGQTFTASHNFGSPAYSESGGNSDASGFGNFSMSVPSGFFSICTKNLAEYG